MTTKEELLRERTEHYDTTAHDVVPVVESMRHIAFTARDLYRAANIGRCFAFFLNRMPHILRVVCAFVCRKK